MFARKNHNISSVPTDFTNVGVIALSEEHLWHHCTSSLVEAPVASSISKLVWREAGAVNSQFKSTPRDHALAHQARPKQLLSRQQLQNST
jgi:hypothetical protein